MARPKLKPEERRVQKSHTYTRAVVERLSVVCESAGVSESTFINEVLLSVLYSLPLPLYASSGKMPEMSAV